MWSGRRSILPWATAAGTAWLAQALLPGAWYIVVGGLCGSLVGAWTSTDEPQPRAASEPAPPTAGSTAPHPERLSPGDGRAA
jgi:hypothetical protein